MSKLDKRFEEDRQMRDAARAVLLADIDHARTSFSGKGMAERFVGRVGDGAKDVFETAREHSDDNRGVIAALVGAIFLWFAREPLLDLFGLSLIKENSESEPGEATPDENADEQANANFDAELEDYGIAENGISTDTPPGDDDEH